MEGTVDNQNTNFDIKFQYDYSVLNKFPDDFFLLNTNKFNYLLLISTRLCLVNYNHSTSQKIKVVTDLIVEMTLAGAYLNKKCFFPSFVVNIEAEMAAQPANIDRENTTDFCYLLVRQAKAS